MRKLALIAAVCLLTACKKDIQTKDAVKAGLDEYLKARQATTGLNMDLMKVEITSVSFAPDGDTAQANVSFTPKAGGPGMEMSYAFEKKEGKWVVKPGATGGSPHGGMGGGANPHGGMETAPPAAGDGAPPLPSLPEKK